MREKLIPTISRTMIYALLILLTLFILLPFFWMFANSFKSWGEMYKYIGLQWQVFFPENPTFRNYIQVFDNSSVQLDFLRVIFNTIGVAVASVALNLAINVMAAYSFARFRFPGRTQLFMLMLFVMIIPGDILLLPLYKMARSMGLINSLAGVLLPSLANPFLIFFMRQFFLEIPKDLEEAATIDGSGRFNTYLKIMLPQVKSPIITISILTFLAQWDNFIWPVTIITSQPNFMLQMSLQYIAIIEDRTDYGILYAGAVISVLPIIIMFLFAQKYYIQSVVASGIKG